MAKKLSEIAKEMRAAVDGRTVGWTEAPLARGLLIAFGHREGRYRLVLRREGVYPSEQEMAICCREFGVPLGTEPAQRIAKDWSKGYKRLMYTVELAWTELPVVSGQAAGVRGQAVAA